MAMRILGLVAAYSLPECKLLKIVPGGSHPEWPTIPLDGKTLYVAVAGDDAVTVVDNQTLQIVKKIAVGAVPKRNTSGIRHTE